MRDGAPETIERLGPELFNKNRAKPRDLCANVDFFSGFVYDMLNIPVDLYTPILRPHSGRLVRTASRSCSTADQSSGRPTRRFSSNAHTRLWPSEAKTEHGDPELQTYNALPPLRRPD